MAVVLKTAAGRVFGAGAVLVLRRLVDRQCVSRALDGADSLTRRHTYGIRVRGGVDLFFPPWLGWFMDHALWIFLALVIVTALAEWWNRRDKAAVRWPINSGG